MYADIAGWHLYMRDMGAAAGSGGKMAQALAECLGPQARNGLRAADVEAVLRKIPVRLGGGRNTLPLYDLMPSACVNDLVQILEDFARK